MTAKKIILIGNFRDALTYMWENGYARDQVLHVEDWQDLRGIYDVPYVLLPSFYMFGHVKQRGIRHALTMRSHRRKEADQ